jgi:hypothetical protein
LAEIFLIPNSSVSIKRTVSQFMFSSSAIILTVNLQPDRTHSLTRAALSSVRVDDGRHFTAYLQQGFRLQKTFCASERLMLLTLRHLQKSAYVFHVLWWHSHRVWHKKGHTAERYSVLPFSQGSQPHSDTSSTYFTLRHWQDISVCGGLGEGPRLNRLRVLPIQLGKHQSHSLLSDLVQ